MAVCLAVAVGIEAAHHAEAIPWRLARPSVAIKCELPSPLHHIPDRQKNLIERIAKLRKEAKKDWVNLDTRGRGSSGNGRALRQPRAPLTKRLHIVANDGCNGDPYDLAVKWGRFIKEAQNAGSGFGDWEPPLFYRTDPDGVETEILLPRPRRLADNEDGEEGEDDPFDSGGRYTIPCGAAHRGRGYNPEVGSQASGPRRGGTAPVSFPRHPHWPFVSFPRQCRCWQALDLLGRPPPPQHSRAHEEPRIGRENHVRGFEYHIKLVGRHARHHRRRDEVE